MKLTFIILVLFNYYKFCFSLNNGLARTPPMGWMSWERFRCNIDCDKDPRNCISEDLIISQAYQIVKLGFLKAGYEYVAIDDCWLNKTRDSKGYLIPDPIRFPNGMKYIGDMLHSMGLKFGLYEDFGTKTCAGYPGSLNYMEQDVKTFVSWGVDYIKLDGCYSSTAIQPTGYAKYESYLNASKRPVVFSCSWPAYFQVKNINNTNLKLLQNNCNLWRMFDDIQNSWTSVLSIINFYKSNPNTFSSWAGPGQWNDPDELLIGNPGLTYAQQRVQMGMWAIFAAPLMMSNDLRNISTESINLLINPNILKIDQDILGKQGSFISETNNVQLWTRELVNKSYVVAVLNAGTLSETVHISLNQTKIPHRATDYIITDAFSMKSNMTIDYNAPITFEVQPTSIEMMKVF